MPNIDLENLIKANPQVNGETLKKVFSVLEEMEKNGIADVGYRILDPFHNNEIIKKEERVDKKIRFGYK